MDGSAPYRWLFLDLNSFFASVEQQENAELRGVPIAVVPVEADSSFVIAASYEAKRYGVKTGTRIGDAKAMCPDLRLIKGNHKVYVRYHDRILEAVESVAPIDSVCSIDELRVRLLKSEASEEASRQVALRIKRAIRDAVGPCLTSSIGLAPNPFLAKLATELQKPDGLVHLLPEDLPERLCGLKLTDLPGINRRLAVRLNLAGIFTTAHLLAADQRTLRRAFGGVLGARWWHLLRGHDIPDPAGPRRSLSNSHVLPPEFRSRDGAYKVMLRLIEKATARLRSEGLTSRRVHYSIRCRSRDWEAEAILPPTSDTVQVFEAFRDLYRKGVIEAPHQVAVTFSDLTPRAEVPRSLFESNDSRERLCRAIDEINRKYGKHTVLPAGLVQAEHTAEERIAFSKTSLFDEGSAA